MGSLWQGDRVCLRGIEPQDWRAFLEFDLESDDMRHAWQLMPPRSAEGYRRWAAEAGVAPDAEVFRLTIESLDERAVVGCLNTINPDPHHGTFGYGVAIGRRFQRRGFAREAVILLLRYMFGERRYQKCNVEIYDTNLASRALHESLGFTLEGRRRRDRYYAGGYHDTLLMGLTVEEVATTSARLRAVGLSNSSNKLPDDGALRTDDQ